MPMLNLRCAVFDVPKGTYHAVWRFGYIGPTYWYATQTRIIVQLMSGVIIDENKFISKTTGYGDGTRELSNGRSAFSTDS
jgi:hypothetical protein